MGWFADGEGAGAEPKGACCWSMLGDVCGMPLVGEPNEEIEARLLELWKTDDDADVGADGVLICGYEGL